MPPFGPDNLYDHHPGRPPYRPNTCTTIDRIMKFLAVFALVAAVATAAPVENAERGTGVCYSAIGCKCPLGQNWVGGKCVSACADSTVWDSSTHRCVVLAAREATCYSAIGCKCPLGQNWVGGRCVSACPTGTIWDSTTHRCVAA